MTRRNLTTSLMVVAAGLLLFGGVALAHDQQTRDDHIVPAAIQPAATFDDHGADASESPEIQAGDDHGADASESPEIQAGDDHGADATHSPDASASPSLDDKTPSATAGATSSVEDGGGHSGSH